MAIHADRDLVGAAAHPFLNAGNRGLILNEQAAESVPQIVETAAETWRSTTRTSDP